MRKARKSVANASHAARLLVEARVVPSNLRLEDYADSISELRRKNLSFSQIADWLQARGVKANRGQVHYVFRRHVIRPD